MAKTILQVHQGGIHFYLNTKSSSPDTGHRNRFRLFKTENYGRNKSGWIQVGSMAGQELKSIEGEAANGHHGAIRGTAGKWEGEAFPVRQSHLKQKLAAEPACSVGRDLGKYDRRFCTPTALHPGQTGARVPRHVPRGIWKHIRTLREASTKFLLEVKDEASIHISATYMVQLDPFMGTCQSPI